MAENYNISTRSIKQTRRSKLHTFFETYTRVRPRLVALAFPTYVTCHLSQSIQLMTVLLSGNEVMKLNH